MRCGRGPRQEITPGYEAAPNMLRDRRTVLLPRELLELRSETLIPSAVGRGAINEPLLPAPRTPWLVVMSLLFRDCARIAHR